MSVLNIDTLLLINNQTRHVSETRFTIDIADAHPLFLFPFVQLRFLFFFFIFLTK